MKCSNCNTELPDGATFCTQCGAALAAANGGAQLQQGEGKPRMLYIVLAVLAGALGIHNFYAGRTTVGITQLVATIFSFILFWFVWFLGIIFFPFLFISFFFLFVPFGIWVWAVIEAFTVKVDGKGIPFTA